MFPGTEGRGERERGDGGGGKVDGDVSQVLSPQEESKQEVAALAVQPVHGQKEKKKKRRKEKKRIFCRKPPGFFCNCGIILK